MIQNFISFTFPAFSQQPNSINKKKIHNSTKVSTRLQSYMDSSSSLIVSFFFNSASYFFNLSFIFSYVHKNKSSVQVGFFFFS